MHELAVLEAGHAEDETHQRAVVVEGPGDNAAEFLCDEEHRGGDALGEGDAPGEALQFDAATTVVVGVKIPDLQGGRGEV